MIHECPMRTATDLCRHLVSLFIALIVYVASIGTGTLKSVTYAHDPGLTNTTAVNRRSAINLLEALSNKSSMFCPIFNTNLSGTSFSTVGRECRTASRPGDMKLPVEE